jgi:predicted dehydrogenase
MDQRTTAAVGIIGCGNIFERYLTGMSRFAGLSMAGCADADQARADAAAATFGIRAYPSPAALLADPGVDVVVNITPPQAHAAVSIAAMRAGKHVYTEKPLAAALTDADEVLAVQAATGRVLGCAPDTILGSAAQTARAAVDSSLIGDPIGAAVFVTHSRAEEWHPDPGFLFRPGGGPLLDMGPYYIAGLVNCLGPVATVAAMTRIGQNPRVVTTPGRLVDAIDVTVATHASAVLGFASGVIGTVLMSFDIWSQDLPFAEIYGTSGRLRLPDPNGFDGDVLVKLNSEDDWRVLDPVIKPSGRVDTGDQMLRGMGVADLAGSLRGAPHRASAELGYHVLEVLESIERASREHAEISLKSTCERPAPLTEAMGRRGRLRQHHSERSGSFDGTGA